MAVLLPTLRGWVRGWQEDASPVPLISLAKQCGRVKPFRKELLFYQWMPVPKTSPEFDRFKDGMTRLMRVPHSEIQQRLAEEQKVRSRKRTHKGKIAAFRAANGKD